MFDFNVPGIGITMPKPAPDLSNMPHILDDLEKLEIDAVEVKAHEMFLVQQGRVAQPMLTTLRQSCDGRRLDYSLHGPKSINFCDHPDRLARHFEVLRAYLDIAADIGAYHYVLHSGRTQAQPFGAILDANKRQQEWLQRAGDLAKERNLHICVETMIGGSEGKIATPTAAQLAQELAKLAHSNVHATFDVSHASLRAAYLGEDFLAQATAIAPYAKHLHVHDSFQCPVDIVTYSDAEKLAFGLGDLHLPLGWGNIPWDEIVDTCAFPAQALLIIELNSNFWHLAADCVEYARRLALRVKSVERSAA